MDKKVKGLCIATRYASVAELVERMHRFCDGTTLFVATRDTRAVGTDAPFAIQLADKRDALRGWCVVLEAWTTTDNPYRRPGVRLGLKRLTPASEVVFEQLKAAARASGAAGPDVPSITSRIAALALGGERRGDGEGDAERLRVEVAPTRGERQRRSITVRIPAMKVTVPAGAPGELLEPTAARRATATPAEPYARTKAARAIAAVTARTRSTGAAIAAEVAVSLADSTPPPPAGPAAARTRTRENQPTLPLRRGERRTPAPLGSLALPVERTPGSHLVLPANPLMNLTDASLEGFVDCRLYEDAAMRDPDAPRRPPTQDDAPPLPPPPQATAPDALPLQLAPTQLVPRVPTRPPLSPMQLAPTQPMPRPDSDPGRARADSNPFGDDGDEPARDHAVEPIDLTPPAIRWGIVVATAMLMLLIAAGLAVALR